jgi:preprotein translocase subunit SecE
MANPFRTVRIYSSELIAELQKASWPTREELKDSTIVVIVACLLLGVFISTSDFALFNFVDLVTTLIAR